jgi:hypothetical protein
MWTVLYILGILTIIGLANYYTNEIGEAYYEGEKKIDKIFDIVHEYTPDLHQFELAVNILPLLLLGSLVFLSNGKALLLEFAGKYLLLHLIRSLTIISTILPKHEQCSRDKSIFRKVLGDCYDKVFSGHTALVFLLTLMLAREGYLNMVQLVALNAIESSIILLTRSHYTIDVILAYFITYLVYDGDYHIFTNFTKKMKL